MPSKCNCAGSSCSCLFVAGAGVEISGVGSADRPYTISAGPVSDSVVLPPEVTQYTLGVDTPALGAMNAFAVEFGGSVATADIIFPDGTTGVALPPAGSQFDIQVTGSETADYNFISPAAFMVWVVDQPTGNQQGLYHFVYLPASTGEPRYLATFVG